ncbi:MAG: N-acetylmuramoyl-L-alanine amidase [Candidatus Delongbacteria bacterium]|nr:N-acetylmuramoyl-L-alanine amidase [Candidatus Delongbacteria bacterium]
MKNYIFILVFFVTGLIFSQGVMFQTILIDPGHGGPGNRGALGRNGTEYPDEADINLQVGLTLRTNLLSLLATVIMTRTTDAHVDNGDRAIMINTYEPDAAVSIHFNSNSWAWVQGTKTIYYRPWISYSLAYAIHHELLKIGFTNFGISQRGGLEVLNSVDPSKNIPVCLVEPYYISEIDGWNQMVFGGGIIGSQQVATYINNGLTKFFDNNYSTVRKTSLSPEENGSNVDFHFDYSSVAKSSSYNLYSSDNPEQDFSSWTLEYSGSNTNWSTSVTSSRKFYKLQEIVNADTTYSDIVTIIKYDCLEGINWLAVPS